MQEFETNKKWLLERQEILMVRIKNIKVDAAQKNNADWSEQAQERENDEVIDEIGKEAEKELHQIGSALDRLKNNTYGICKACLKPIPTARLEILPYTDTCIGCK